MEPEPHKSPIRFYEIDLLRFVAAVSVVIYHYCFLGYHLQGLSPVRYEGIESITKYGYLGVQLFFIISGYVVLMSAQGKTVRQFFLSRVTRLYPAFWVACTLTFLAILFFGPTPGEKGWSKLFEVTPIQYVANMTMLQGFVGYADIDSPYWTLSVEISFYFLISLLLSYQLFKNLGLVLSLWLLYTAAVSFSSAAKTPFHYLFIPEYSPFFIAGMAFYLLQNKLLATWKLYSLLFISLLLGLRSAQVEAQAHSDAFAEPFSLPIIYTVIVVIFVVFWLVIKRKIDLSRFTWLSKLGAITYPLYLLHGNIGYLVFQKLGGQLDKYILLITLVFLMLLAAHLIHVLVEKRIGKPLGKQVNKLLTALG